MKVLVFNGSPRGEKSSTMRLTNAFLAGMQEAAELDVEILPVYQMNLKPCKGCFTCWTGTPGQCCLKDDMAAVIEKQLSADVMIWSFPLYYFSLPSQLKALMERQLPMVMPNMVKRTDGNSDCGSHPSRYDMSGKRYLLISTCGFYTPEGNYDAVNRQFELCCGKDGFETLYCGEGELFNVPELKARTDEYLDTVKAAGREYATGKITSGTREKLSELLYPREVFEQMADASWEISSAEQQPKTDTDGSLPFTRQIAALYRKDAWQGKDIVLEMCYTDLNKTYQIVMRKTGSEVLTENFLPFTTRIETPYPVWRSIAKGEIGGQQAMMEHKYRTMGDFDLMLRWDDYFGGTFVAKQQERTESEPKKTNMTMMLLPWITIWVALTIHPLIGGVLGIVTAAALPFAFIKWKPTIFEYLTIFLVSLISLSTIIGAPVEIMVPIAYLLFGVFWTATLLLKTPLTAYYSKNNYGGDKALENPLFLKTNWILTACWGVLYLITPVWTYYLMNSPAGMLTAAINWILPAALGVFTAWFQKWYPTYYAAK